MLLSLPTAPGWAGWAARCMAVGATAVGTAAFTHTTVKAAAPGKARLLAALPVLALYLALPFAFPQAELLSRASCAAMLLWLASFKVEPMGWAGHGMAWHGWANAAWARVAAWRPALAMPDGPSYGPKCPFPAHLHLPTRTMLHVNGVWPPAGAAAVHGSGAPQ